jgi:uncharacterized membrane protein
MISLTHIVFCITSLILGPFIFLNIKGDRRHRWVGRLYGVSMLALNFSALAIYNLTGHFNFFHFTALLSLAMVLTGWAQVVFRHRLRNWLYRHYIYMCWSYVALIAAAFNEGFVRLAPLKALVRHTGNWAIIATQVVLLGAAALVINRRKPKLLARYADSAMAQPSL